MARDIRLSVNVNKVATVRNSRGGALPSPVLAARTILQAGAGGVTVHPRADERHIRASDVREIAALLTEPRTRGVEYNIEGDPRPEWLALVHEVRPDQATLVPVRAGELTSEAGWAESTDAAWLQRIVGDLQRAGIRVSLFIEAQRSAVDWAKQIGADRVELYTYEFAAAFARSAEEGKRLFAQHVQAAERAHELGLGVNAGHDLDLDNLVVYRALPHLAEVSIGHALISRALFVGLAEAVREYVAVLRG
jgi:pyridoxine 5-phosphate synthase